MGHYHLRDYRHRPVYSCCPPSDTYNSYPYRVRKGRQVLRASHPNIHLVPKPYFSMNISNIWLIEKGLINGQEKPDIQLLAMWDPGYACNVIHESVVKHLPRQAAETSTVGSYTVFARLNLDWTNSDHPENGWRTRHHPFYVTTQAMPKGVKVIIGSKSGSESPETIMRDMAAPVHGPVQTSKEKQDQQNRAADRRAQRDLDQRARDERVERDYQLLLQQQYQQQQQQQLAPKASAENMMNE